MAATPQETERRSVLVLMAGALALTAITLWPLSRAFFLAAVFALALEPVYRFLLPRLWGKPWLAGGLVLLGVVALVLTPLSILAAQVVAQAGDAVRSVSEILRTKGIEGVVAALPAGLSRLARAVLERLPHEPGEGYGATLEHQLSAVGSAVAASAGAAVATTGSLLFQTVMMLIALFFFLTDGRRMLALVDEYSPLGKGRTRELLQEFRNTTVAVLKSNILTALAQTVLAAIGYLIARAPLPVLFTAATFLFAFVPAVGATGVVLLVAAILALTGSTGMAIFLALWGLFAVGLIDNLIKPLVIRGGAQMNGAVVFFSLIGGLAAFGPVGLLLGPLSVALTLAVLRIYRRDFA